MTSPDPSPQLQFVDVDQEAWRVSFAPDPWAWPGWQWAGADGRFGGRWDDLAGTFRTVYAASTLLGCFLEVLAGFRPDPAVAAEYATITTTDEDSHPTIEMGTLPHAWLEQRRIARAQLTGCFCAVTAAETIAALRPRFVAAAHTLHLHDFDAAALKAGQPRELTQAVASHLHATTTADGVAFASRHGDDLPMWAIFERAEDLAVSRCLTDATSRPIHPDDPDLQTAMQMLGLHWARA